MHLAPNETMRLKPAAAFHGLGMWQPMVVAGVEMSAHAPVLPPLEIELMRGLAELQEVLHFTSTSDRMPVRLRLRTPTATPANCRAGRRTLHVRAGLTAQAPACSATVANASGQCGSGRGTGAPASSKRLNTAA
jgi:hypothetical protein